LALKKRGEAQEQQRTNLSLTMRARGKELLVIRPGKETVFNDRPEHFQRGRPFDFLPGLARSGRVINGHFLDHVSSRKKFHRKFGLESKVPGG